MQRARWWGLALVIVATMAGLVALRSATTQQPVYSVDAVVTGLARHPHAWLGRTVLVRGTVLRLAYSTVCHAFAGNGGCLTHVQQRLVMEAQPHMLPLEEEAGPGQGPPRGLMLAPGPRNVVLTWLAHLPVVGHLVGAGGTGVHRLRLLSVQSCLFRGCVNALLLDTRP